MKPSDTWRAVSHEGSLIEWIDCTGPEDAAARAEQQNKIEAYHATRAASKRFDPDPVRRSWLVIAPGAPERRHIGVSRADAQDDPRSFNGDLMA